MPLQEHVPRPNGENDMSYEWNQNNAKKMIPPRTMSTGRSPFGLRNDSNTLVLCTGLSRTCPFKNMPLDRMEKMT